MQRLLRMSIFLTLLAFFGFFAEEAKATTTVMVSGRVAPESVRVFVKDSIYVIDHKFVIGGTLIIEPGTTIKFYANGLMVDSVGGRIIADGMAKALYIPNPTYKVGFNDVTVNPRYPLGSKNPEGWTGYADLNYFLYGLDPTVGIGGNAQAEGRTIEVQTERDPTIHENKYNHIFNLVLDNSDDGSGYGKRLLSNLENPLVAPGTDKTIIPFEYALMMRAARLENDPDKDIEINIAPWQRIAGRTVNIGLDMNGNALSDDENQIRFSGQPINDASSEWGHIVVLPGARGVFFRNCSFEGFRKDTAAHDPFYNEEENPDWDWTLENRQIMNNTMRYLANGSGGVITSFSSRLWLLDCEFKNNFARHHGGAVQFLQAPAGFPVDNGMEGDEMYRMYDIYNVNIFDLTADRYGFDKNPNVTGPDGDPSDINCFWAARDDYGAFQMDSYGHLVEGTEGVEGPNSNMVPEKVRRLPAIDLIDEAGAEPTFNFADDSSKADYYRQANDDGRLAIYLGRVRNCSFENNKAQLANFGRYYVGNPPMPIVGDITDEPWDDHAEYGDEAFGGAIYLESSDNKNHSIDWLIEDPMGASWLANRNQKMEVAFGINDMIKVENGTSSITFTPDEFVCTGNSANNYSNHNEDPYKSMGARGGAIYVGDYTSLIVAGQVNYNSATAKFLVTDETNPNEAYMFAMGGGIFANSTEGRLQLRGGPDRQEGTVDNPTEFIENKAAAGGALAVTQNLSNSENYLSPVIGGSDDIVPTRDYGYNVSFLRNEASCFGGAVYTERNTTINGAGGVEVNTLIGYGGKYPVMFNENTAGFAGGAVEINLPGDTDLAIDARTVSIVRTRFWENTVGMDVEFDDNKARVRGGGAVYSSNATINLVKGTHFIANEVRNGNGGAVNMVHPQPILKRFFISDIDQINYDPMTGFEDGITQGNGVFTYQNDAYPASTDMLTIFSKNEVMVDEDILETQSGSGTTQIGKGSLGTFENLLGIGMQNENKGFTVGANGTAIQLVDGGSIWNYKNLGTNRTLNDVWFQTAMKGFIAGDEGVVLLTTNGGDAWSAPASINWVLGGNEDLYDVAFSGFNIGYIVGENGLVLRTTDGGQNWTELYRAVPNNLYSAHFTGIYGHTVGERGIILKTTDSGQLWIKKESNTLSDLNDVYFTSVNDGFIVGNNGVILSTFDAGNTWEALNSGTMDDLNSFAFAGTSTHFAAGDNGTILKTVDDGETWVAKTSGVTGNINSIFFYTMYIGYAVGDDGLIINTLDGGETWNEVRQADRADADVVRYHEGTRLPENGVGLGGGLYVIDQVTMDRVARPDSIFFNRVRMMENIAYSGGAVYSDNYDLKLVFSKSLIARNEAYSEIGMEQNVITGPFFDDNNSGTVTTYNYASSDLAGSIIYGEIQGPLPSTMSPWAANSIYGNVARFLIRLPDAPNSKGLLSGETGMGHGGTDTLRGNYWGATEANVDMEIQNNHILSPDGTPYAKAVQETFFVQKGDSNSLNYAFWETPTDRENLQTTMLADSSYIGDKYLLYQGPFESPELFEYIAIPLMNDGDQNTPHELSIPENLLQSGRIYDLYDKGTDIKTADMTKRRMSPIEDFAVGIPPIVKRYDDEDLPSNGKYVRRLVRDPFIADSVTEADENLYPYINALQTEFIADAEGKFYHPVGYPLYLETMVDYSGLVSRSNHDPDLLNETVFFVINEATGDFIRVNLKQVTDQAPYRETFRARVELVPDLTYRPANSTERRTKEGLMNLGRGSVLLGKLRRNPDLEDGATLLGRRYIDNEGNFAMISNLYNNRPDMPITNQKGGNNKETYYAGERYGALPVNAGDSVRVVSRTVLWGEDVGPAFDDGIVFYMTESTEPPVYTEDIVGLMTDTLILTGASQYPWRNMMGLEDTVAVVELLNTVFVSEDRMYPVPEYLYSNPDYAVGQGLFSDFEALVRKYGNPLLECEYSGQGTTVGENAEGRDKILDVTAIDNNNFYDPRWLHASASYSPLDYTFSVKSKTGLSRWLIGENTFGDEGHMIFRGRPTNPYVVPGGETVTLMTYNFPPNFRTLDKLKELNERLIEAGLDPIAIDSLDKFMEVFKPYMNVPEYNVEFARFLQQDTINVGLNNFREYEFKLFVIDSVPVFLDPLLEDPYDPEHGYWSTDLVETLEDGTEIWGREVIVDTNSAEDYEVMGYYLPSIYHCYRAVDGRIRANVTDKFRFQMDINTDDEIEDTWAEETGWNFRYGRTAYGFTNTAYRPDADAEGDEPGEILEQDVIVTQTKPLWMDEAYMYKYDKEDIDNKDEFGSDFTYGGRINIRIEKEEAMLMLQPANQYNGALNTDTVFTVVVNDGHSGINKLEVPVMINIEPEIITTELLEATEDVEYSQVDDTDVNLQLLDSLKMIQFYDPNFDQEHRFELVKPDYEETSSWAGLIQYDTISGDGTNGTINVQLPRDPCFLEAGYRLLETRVYVDGELSSTPFSLMQTPGWLNINEISGLLYGVPRVKDAPREGDDAEQVTVIVWDEDSLSASKVYDNLDHATEHMPEILTIPSVKCFDLGREDYDDTVFVFDRDLMRGRNILVDGELVPDTRLGRNITDTLTITIEDEDGNPITDITVDPSTLFGIEEYGFEGSPIVLHADKGATGLVRDDDGRITIIIRVEDNAGNVVKMRYRIKLSDETDFICPVTVENQLGAYQVLTFGTADAATAGEGFDGEELGQLDRQYCEYEIPPIPYEDVFDARWTIGNTYGTLRNIFFTGNNTDDLRIYRATFQAGSDQGQGSNNFPVVISWDKTDVPAIDDATANPNGATWLMKDPFSDGQYFTINMATGAGAVDEGDIELIETGDEIKIVIHNDKIDGFRITHDWITGVEVVTGVNATALTSAMPNPFDEATTINFSVKVASEVRIEVIDQLGQVVRVLTDGSYAAGINHSTEWDGRDSNGNELASGTYTCRLIAGEVSSAIKVIIVK
jgi:photosystem II stability/assembly factor-like uncharacterized protein